MKNRLYVRVLSLTLVTSQERRQRSSPLKFGDFFPQTLTYNEINENVCLCLLHYLFIKQTAACAQLGKFYSQVLQLLSSSVYGVSAYVCAYVHDALIQDLRKTSKIANVAISPFLNCPKATDRLLI